MDKEELVSKVREYHQLFIDLATGRVSDDFYGTYERARTDLLSLDQSISPAIPKWIYDHKYGSNFWSFIKGVSGTYQDRRNFINNSFDDLYDYLDKGADQPISVSIEEINRAIQNDYVDLLWKKIYSRKSFDKEGALTACKALIETVLKHLLDVEDVEYSNKDDIKDLYKKVSTQYQLEPAKQKNDGFKKLCSGCISVVDGVAMIRNAYGDAHGKNAVESELPQHHVDFVINMTGSISTFLLSLSKSATIRIDEED